ncbi:guanosine-3',5'-bis(diphosphate) 3'-pyrophosphohydrolase MESH1 [Diachasma alloeum]|uniref:guanosine-3',5'-bis(diphosphate) 3'-pyrophosphohydrolase MESH1 n=1 Tax=Diachasma alloeum TaxID=454923 RepID=UPI0007383131|nr:guanosine-3',5'-bis(diphosphate) 3'-pyrophosphohydrolase MESH1 [Diachasma alloeum]XP_015124528.1 guanosine-3',5'-bis(diphosphate) 3'-pyrophosphohydrolase MESH1 [Diachasma alloeum]XP_015124529.1 guanosine-3',5'-bis(diphosphate) 3'-pyrophosphohydrolase MESH1 [Diachasma alloeum]
MTTISPRDLSKGQLLSLVLKCSDFAAKKHKRQKRMDKEGTPYINHPLGVANILTEEGDVHDPVVILSAILHDTVEDTETTFEEIEREFGSEVKLVVSEVTDDKTLPKMERKQLQIDHSPHISHEAKLVKLADKIYNLRDLRKEIPVGWTAERAHEYFKWAEQVIQGCRGTNERLEAILDEIFASEKMEHEKMLKKSA